MRELAANAGLKKIPKGEGINTMHGCRRNNGSRSARITDISDVAKRSGTGHNSIEGFDIYSTVDLESKAKLSAGIQGNGAAAALKSALAKRSALEEQSPHTEIKKRPLEERSSNTTSEMGHSRKKKTPLQHRVRHKSNGSDDENDANANDAKNDEAVRKDVEWEIQQMQAKNKNCAQRCPRTVENQTPTPRVKVVMAAIQRPSQRYKSEPVK